MIGIGGGVGQHDRRTVLGQQDLGLRRIARLAAGQPDPHGAAKVSHR